MSTDYIPKSDGKFLEFAKTIVKYVTDHIDMFRITPETLASIQALLTSFEEYYTIYLAPNRGKVDVLNKTNSRKALESALRVFIKGYITYNPEISDAVRESMGLPIHDVKPSPAPTVLSYPEYEIDSSTIRRVIIKFHNSGSTSKAKPKGVHGAEIRMEVLAEPPVSVDGISQSRFSTRSPYTAEFDENQRGQAVYICLRWENNKGEKGPWGEIVKAIIP
jgi:hypothetical protein